MTDPKSFLEYLSKRSGFDLDGGDREKAEALKRELDDLMAQFIHLAKTTNNPKEKLRYVEGLGIIYKIYAQVEEEFPTQGRKTPVRSVAGLDLDVLLNRIRGGSEEPVSDDEAMRRLDELIFEALDRHETSEGSVQQS